MSSAPFNKVLALTGYLTSDGGSAPGLTRQTDANALRMRSVLQDERVGLAADAVFSVQGTPTTIFKDSATQAPDEAQVQRWHEAAWNLGAAPLLWIVTPTSVRLYDCYAAPAGGAIKSSDPLEIFSLDSTEDVTNLNAMCGRLATETGAFWASPVGKKIDRRRRVDRELLNEINALEEALTALPPAHESGLSGSRETKASRDFAQRLIGRCIFTWYLLDRGIAQPFLPTVLQTGLGQIFASRRRTFALFNWLRKTFGGDLFPMDDPGAEHHRLSDAHLALMQEFIAGRSLVPEMLGQGRLFRFRFDAIPVDLISSIYQQFARSSAQQDAHLQGLHYTPIEVVHLTLDPVMEGVSGAARVIDPACGSGAFLVEAFRRLVWKNGLSKSVTRQELRDILYEQLFGIDINRSALGIAAFSLYLAALEFDSEPITAIEDLKFRKLIGETLFEADTISGDLPQKVAEKPFDAVVGNPPWTYDSRRALAPRKEGDEGTARPRRSPDQAFLAVAGRLAGETGRIGMIMKATPFFSKDDHAVLARNILIRNLQPVAIMNLSALRKEELFPDATGPALLFFSRCALTPRPDQMLVGSFPWGPDFRRNGMFQIGPGEMRSVPVARVLRTPAFLKAATFGTVRDGWLIDRLENEFATLDTVLSEAGLAPLRSRGQGFQVEGDLNEPPKSFYRLKVLTPKEYTPFRVQREQLQRLQYQTLHRPREPAIYKGPLVICPKASFKAAAQLGRYSVSVSDADLLYTESFYGISFNGRNENLAHAVSAILNSSIATFQLAFGGGAWGLERSTVEPKDLLSLRVPNIFAKTKKLSPLVKAEQSAAANPTKENLQALDRAVADYYGLEPEEGILADESIERARMLVFEARAERQRFTRPPLPDVLKSYSSAVTGAINNYLRANGDRHLQATIYQRAITVADWDAGSSGLTAVRLSMCPGRATAEPIVQTSDEKELNSLGNFLLTKLQTDIAPYINERRLLRIYLGDDLFVVKPNEARYWTQTAGLNDADIILADHWAGGLHAARA